MALRGMRNQQSITLSSVGGFLAVEPRLIDYRIPHYTAGKKFDVLWLFSVPILFADAPQGGTFIDHFNFEGSDLGTPNLYRKLPLSADKTLEWKQRFDTALLAEDTEIESFDNPSGEGDWTNANLTTEPATLYLLRWDPVVKTAQGIVSVTLEGTGYGTAPRDLYYTDSG